MRLSLGALALLVSCAAPPHAREIVLHIVTNSPVSGDAKLFHRVRVGLVSPGETTSCPNCWRSFDATSAEATISLVPQRVSDGYKVEVTLYRAQFDDAPNTESSISRRVGLPALQGATELHVNVFLDVADVGKGFGDNAPQASQLDSWTRGASVPCAASLGPNEVCVPGGAFWMGSRSTVVGLVPNDDGQHERIVVVSPFVLDAYEVTDAQFRASGDVPYGPIDGKCGFKPLLTPPTDGDFPVACITWRQADRYCKVHNARLPTESELEYVEGAMRSAQYPWGARQPTCADANYDTTTESCPNAKPVGPSKPGAFASDTLTVGGRTLFDLVGNVAELAQDQYETSGGNCWTTGILYDPVCASVENKGARALKGGSYNWPSTKLRSSYRAYVEDERAAIAESIGFRCARSIN